MVTKVKDRRDGHDRRQVRNTVPLTARATPRLPELG